MTRGRFPRALYARGSEPDARFSLANERTFLAWVGAGLALISVGVGLESLALNLEPHLRLAAAAVLVLGGTACPVQAWFGWRRVEGALREGRPLPSAQLLWLLPCVIAAAGTLILLGMFLA
ncbi:MAG: YidH family protein [Cellulomonadaceae bacterium]